MNCSKSNTITESESGQWFKRISQLYLRETISEITEAEMTAPLQWTCANETDAVLLAAIDFSHQTDSMPLFVALPVSMGSVPSVSAATLGALLEIGIKLRLYNIACGHTDLSALTGKGQYCVIPISVLAPNSTVAFQACRNLRTNPMFYWRRYIEHCRQDIIQQMHSDILEKTRARCWFCGANLIFSAAKGSGDARRKFHVDHIVPRSNGGSDDLENLVPSCRSCNLSKGSKSLEQFRHYKAAEALSHFCEEGNRPELIHAYRFWGERRTT